MRYIKKLYFEFLGVLGAPRLCLWFIVLSATGYFTILDVDWGWYTIAILWGLLTAEVLFHICKREN